MKGDTQIKVPDNISDEEAATLGTGVGTVVCSPPPMTAFPLFLHTYSLHCQGQALYQRLQLAFPDKPIMSPAPVLIYGGSTATGILAIQFAKASGYTVLATASLRHEEYLRSIGADAVFDYSSPTWAADVKVATNGGLKLAFDCIGTVETAKPVAQAMSDDGGRYTTTEDPGAQLVQVEYPHINADAVLVYTAMGEEFVFGDVELETWKVVPADFEFAVMFSDLVCGLLESGRMKPVRTTVDFGGKGFEGVLVGLEELRQGKVRGGKLVYHV